MRKKKEKAGSAIVLMKNKARGRKWNRSKER